MYFSHMSAQSLSGIDMLFIHCHTCTHAQCLGTIEILMFSVSLFLALSLTHVHTYTHTQGPTNRPISMQDLKSLDGHRVEKVPSLLIHLLCMCISDSETSGDTLCMFNMSAKKTDNNYRNIFLVLEMKE